MNGKKLVYLLIGLFFLTGVFGFSYKGNNVDDSYAEGEIIRGSINISFSDDLAEGKFTSNIVGNITLLGLLQMNGFILGEDYNCSTPNCLADYITSGQTTGFVLSNEKIIGFKISGSDITNVVSTKFRVQSSESASCISPLSIDILDNEEEVLINERYTSYDSCFSTNYGCFDSGASTSFVELSNNLYCEKMTLPVGPAYKIGARVKNTISGSADLEMQLLKVNGDFLKKCALPKHSQEEEDLSCIIEYASSKQKEFLICIRQSNIGGDPNYKIKSETEGSICGTDNLGGSYTRDYEIFARMMKFDNVDLDINDNMFSDLHGQTLSSYINDYVYENYGGYCLPYCVIPVKLYGNSGQELIFSNIEIKYKDGNTVVSSNELYNVAIDAVTIDSGLLNLDLKDVGFVIPKKGNATKFKLYFDGNDVFEKTISIAESFDFDVSPKFVAFGQEVLFEAINYGNVSIVNSEWNFGDGNIESSENDKISYTYFEQGNFDLRISLTREDNITSTRTFQIVVGDAKEIAKETIDKYNSRIVKLKGIVDSYSLWVGKAIENQLDFVTMESDLAGFQSSYDSASSDEEYANIMINLLDYKVPYTINISKSGKLPLSIGGEDIYAGYIEEISSEDVLDESRLEENILGWMKENVDGTIYFEHISAFYEDSQEVIVSKFELDVHSKSNEKSYLILGYSSEGIVFEGNYGERALDGGTYISLGSERRVFKFIILDEIEPDKLGVYVSPVISLVGGEYVEISEPEKKKFRWTIFIIGLVVVLVLGFVSYIVLQEWYKKNYEKTLFKREDELYNLINFIYNARKSGMKDREIKFKLKQSKWKVVQINYAIRKLDGKRTGMYEIPIFKVREKKKVKEELLKRRGGQQGQNIY